jgi:diaminopimelate epimerase
MVYFNSDGAESTMCGNGGRCIVAFAAFLGVIKNNAKFIAIDGEHQAAIFENGIVSLKMKDVSAIEKSANDFILDTGSPHFVRFVDKVSDVDVFTEGRKVRRSEPICCKRHQREFCRTERRNIECPYVRTRCGRRNTFVRNRCNCFCVGCCFSRIGKR